MREVPRLTIPHELLGLLSSSRSPLEAPTLALADELAEVLSDNKMPFFPAFTDHGTEHVSRVMHAAVSLVPDDVWAEGLLGPADAATLIGACLYHDLAMHLREGGFVELVTGDRLTPVPWFARKQGSRSADLPWRQLWEEFARKARHFGRTELDRLLGPRNGGVPAVAYAAELHPEDWRRDDQLLIGEFLRRHHARLSHEMALRRPA